MSYARSFDQLAVGEKFAHGGNVWRKRSKYTAEVVISRTYDGDTWAIHKQHMGTICYFKTREPINFGRGWWEAMGALKSHEGEAA